MTSAPSLLRQLLTVAQARTRERAGAERFCSEWISVGRELSVRGETAFVFFDVHQRVPVFRESFANPHTDTTEHICQSRYLDILSRRERRGVPPAMVIRQSILGAAQKRATEINLRIYTFSEDLITSV